MTEELKHLESNFATTPKLFSKWDYESLEVKDQTLANYISVNTTKAKVFVPHTSGRYQLKKFRKAAYAIILMKRFFTQTCHFKFLLYFVLQFINFVHTVLTGVSETKGIVRLPEII